MPEDFEYADPNDFEDGPVEDYGDKDARPANGR